MIDVLKSLFRPSPAAPDIPPDLAVATLLVEAARAMGPMARMTAMPSMPC